MATSLYTQAKRAASRYKTEASQRQALAKLFKRHGYAKQPVIRQGYFGHGGAELRFYWYEGLPGGDVVLVTARGYKPEVYRLSDLKRIKKPGFWVEATDPRAAVVRSVRTEYAALGGGGKPKKSPKGRKASGFFGLLSRRKAKAAPKKKKKAPSGGGRKAARRASSSAGQLGLFGRREARVGRPTPGRHSELDRLIDDARRDAELADIEGLAGRRRNPRQRNTHLAVGTRVQGSYGKGTVKMQLPGDRYVVSYGRKGRRVEEGHRLRRA